MAGASVRLCQPLGKPLGLEAFLSRGKMAHLGSQSICYERNTNITLLYKDGAGEVEMERNQNALLSQLNHNLRSLIVSLLGMTNRY